MNFQKKVSPTKNVYVIYTTFLQLLSQVQKKAGFIYFSEGCFRDAAELMIDGGLDPREVGFRQLAPTGNQLNQVRCYLL